MKKYILAPVFAFLLFSCTTPQWEAATDSSIVPLSNQDRNAHSVYLTKTNNDEAVICWTEQDIAIAPVKYFYFSVFNPEDRRFTDSTRIPLPQDAALHTEGMPKIAFKSDGTIVAAYEVKTASDLNPYSSEIHYMQSEDQGETWSLPQPVHTNRQPHQGRSFFDVATLANGEVGVSWLGESSPNGGRPVLFAHTGAGNTFINESVVDSIACECCRTALYADKSGLISIVYRDIIADAIRDISVVTSADNGRTFSKPTCFSGDNWNIHGCPHNGPDVVSDSAFVYATWFTGGTEAGVYFAQLDNERQITKKELISKDGRNIQLANFGKGINLVVYSEDMDSGDGLASEIKAVIKPSNQQIQVSQGGVLAHSPVTIAAADQLGLIAWIEKMGRTERVFYKPVLLSSGR